MFQVLRSLSFIADEDRPLISFGADLQDLIGQEPHKLPDVFSYFLPEYLAQGKFMKFTSSYALGLDLTNCRNLGRSGSAAMRCPECVALTGPTAVNLMNGITSLFEFGLDSAYNGFGKARVFGDESARTMFDFSEWPTGHLTYLPEPSQTSTQVVDQLATLLTSGRLSAEKRLFLTQVYDQFADTQEAALTVGQLITSTPEFHSSGLSVTTDKTRGDQGTATPPSNSYKSVVLYFLGGGADTFNVLIPHECSGTNAAGVTVDQQYYNVRGGVAITDRTIQIDANPTDGQPCSKFAIHPKMPLLKELYDAGDLTFLANTGAVTTSK